MLSPSFLASFAKWLGEDTKADAPLINPLQPWMTVPRFHHLLPYESFDPKHKIFYNKGSTGFVLLAAPIVGASLDDQGQIANFFAQEKNLKEGTSLQFLLYASPKIEPALKYWERARTTGIFPFLAQKRAHFLNQKALREEQEMIRDYRIMISYTVPGHLKGIIEQERLILIRRELQATLARVGMTTETMEAEGFIQEMGNILNYRLSTEPERFQWNPYETLDKQILDQDNVFRIEKDCILKEDSSLEEPIIIKSWYPKVAPKYWSLSHMDRFIGDVLDPTQQIPCPYIVHYGFVVNSGQLKEKTKTNTKRESLEKSLKNKMLRWQPQIREEYEEVIEVVEQLQRKQRVITAALSMTVFCPEPQLADVEQALNHMWLAGGWDFSPATYDHLGAFLSLCPMSWTATAKVGGCGDALRILNKAKKTITKEAQNMLPLLGEWKGQATPGLPLTGRRGQMFFWNPFDGMLMPGREVESNTSNYNVCISGTMGSGKSFFANEMITTVLGVGGGAFVLDKGESFKNLCHLLGGHHLDFTNNTDLSLNPFTHIPEGDSGTDKEEQSEQLTAFEQILKTMAMSNDEASSLQESFLKKALQNVWQTKKSKGTVDDIRAWLLNHNDPRAKDLGEMLWAYSSEGMYGRFFNRPATINLNHTLVVIETQNLKDDLRPVIVQMMMVQIWQRMVRSDRRTPFLILIDEAWQLLAGKGGGKFIEAMTRTARKYRASLVLLTQNLTDYFREDSPAARIAFENAAWKCILHQSSEITTAMKDHPHLKEFVSSEYKEQLIRSLLPAKRFSEVAIFGQQIRGIIGRLFCDPYSVLLYSTKPQDYMDVQGFVKQGFSVHEAIEAVLEKRGINQRTSKSLFNKVQKDREVKETRGAA